MNAYVVPTAMAWSSCVYVASANGVQAEMNQQSMFMLYHEVSSADAGDKQLSAGQVVKAQFDQDQIQSIECQECTNGCNISCQISFVHSDLVYGSPIGNFVLNWYLNLSIPHFPRDIDYPPKFIS